jgi:hypothetical protein
MYPSSHPDSFRFIRSTERELDILLGRTPAPADALVNYVTRLNIAFDILRSRQLKPKQDPDPSDRR